jgi:hypothetical protein
MDVGMIIIGFVRVQVQFPAIVSIHVEGRRQRGGFLPMTFIMIKINVSTPVVINTGIRVIVVIVSAPVAFRCIRLLNVSRETARNQHQEHPSDDRDNEHYGKTSHDLPPLSFVRLASCRTGI